MIVYEELYNLLRKGHSEEGLDAAAINRLFVMLRLYRELDDYTTTEPLSVLFKKPIDTEVVLEQVNIIFFDINKARKDFMRNYEHMEVEHLLFNDDIYRPLRLMFHQDMIVRRATDILEESSKILIGAVPRSGKTYIMAGLISERIAANHLVVTTAPSETIHQYMKVFEECSIFKQWTVIRLDSSTQHLLDDEIPGSVIIVCSKQFLQRGVIPGLQNIRFEMRFFDETHFGGTTELAQRTVVDAYSPAAKTVFLTATYAKPVAVFDIPPGAQLTWDLEDIRLCRSVALGEQGAISRLIEKHGVAPTKAECTNYTSYPDLYVLTTRFQDAVKHTVVNDDDGLSVNALLMLAKNKRTFLKEEATIQLLHSVFTGPTSLLGRAQQIAAQVDSRFMGGEYVHTIMCFLPVGLRGSPVNSIAGALKRLIKTRQLFTDYYVLAINGAENGGENPVVLIEAARKRAAELGKKAVIVLSGKQCTLGVTISSCDVVVLFNNCSSYDSMFQTMFRAMSDAPGKRCGFVLDTNFQRAIDIVVDFSIKTRGDLEPREAVQYVLEQRLIALNQDEWMNTYFDAVDISERVYQMWIGVPRNPKDLFQMVSLPIVPPSLRKLLAQMFNIRGGKKKTRIELGADCDVPTGVVSVPVDTPPQAAPVAQTPVEAAPAQAAPVEATGATQTPVEAEEEENEDIVRDIMTYAVPFVSLMTVRLPECVIFGDMLEVIKQDPELFRITVHQFERWWGRGGENMFEIIIVMNGGYLAGNPEFAAVVKRIKKLFTQSFTNQEELSKLIDTYLIPRNQNKQNNAEVSTPYALRQEMLDKIPAKFWKGKVKTETGQSKKTRKLVLPRVFEPCVGKGGFLIDICARFMKGLESAIPNPEKRYKRIVEEVLFFADINPANIYICKMLLDPFKKYSLNYSEGDTLKLDISAKWGFTGFDAVIGNPPYNAPGSTATGNTIWQHFTGLALTKWLETGGYLTFVHPPGWRKPNTEGGKYLGLFDLMTKLNHMLYLEIHDTKDGVRIFGCGTRYDWYVIRKTDDTSIKPSVVVDETGTTNVVNFADWEWLPNSHMKLVHSLLARGSEPRCEIIFSRSAYGSDKDWISSKQTAVYKYPCVHSTPKTGVRFMFSSTNKNGMFGIKKVIFGDSGINEVVIDTDGKYGMTQHSMGIGFETNGEAKKISEYLMSDEFQTVLKACSWSNYMIDWRLFTFFKKKFWKRSS